MPADASNFYTSDEVTLERVSFANQYGMNVAGNLFRPKSPDMTARTPAIVVGHPMGAVKEQSANLYATLSSNVKFLNFYPFNDIDAISPRPMLFITGENAHSREFSEEAYELAGEPKELFVVPGAGHVDLYDRVGLIPFDKITSFFGKHL